MVRPSPGRMPKQSSITLCQAQFGDRATGGPGGLHPAEPSTAPSHHPWGWDPSIPLSRGGFPAPRTALSAGKPNPAARLPPRHPPAGFHLPGRGEVEPRQRLGFRPAPVENLPPATSFSCLPRREAPAAPNKEATPQQRRKRQNSNKAPDKGERSEVRARRRLLRAERGTGAGAGWAQGGAPCRTRGSQCQGSEAGEEMMVPLQGRLLGPLGPWHGRAATRGMLMPRGYR